MDPNAAAWLVLALGLLAANLPFFTERLFLVIGLADAKSLAWRLLEWAVYCTLATAAARLVEARIGQLHPQGWAFYAVLACLYLTFAFPGFVWRHLRKRHPG
ncbi:MAG: DUF2818 family protein [Aquabacterium sp.]|nr:MAG: DUF2818 family protein [Aquabacterium sp.]